MSEGGLHRLDVAVERVVKGLGPQASITTVIRSWTEIVGRTMAGHCRPERLEGGRLTVTARDAGWATELRYQGAEIVARAAGVLGPDVVEHLVIRVGSIGAGTDGGTG